MEIAAAKSPDALVITLTGRLDATWADAVESALATAVRAGEHRIVLDAAGVDYVSSAGLRVLIGAYKQLATVHGCFRLRNPRPVVRNVIELSGLAMLLLEETKAAPEAGTSFATDSAAWESFACPEASAAGMRARAIGEGSAFSVGHGRLVSGDPGVIGLGIAAFAADAAEAGGRLGEFLAVAGCAAHLPAADGHRADFQVHEQNFRPTAWLANGLVAEGAPTALLRFESTTEAGRTPLAEIAQAALVHANAPAAVFVLVAETAGLVGASLRRPPGAEGDPFAFPGIRDRLRFTSERAFRDTTSLVAGFVAAPGTAWSPHLRPIAPDLLLHAHAAVFPYRPVRKGRIALAETVRALFDAGGLQTVLHLLRDGREPDGIGDSEFLRGACWIAPLTAAGIEPRPSESA